MQFPSKFLVSLPYLETFLEIIFPKSFQYCHLVALNVFSFENLKMSHKDKSGKYSECLDALLKFCLERQFVMMQNLLFQPEICSLLLNVLQ
jgi:hypothetical protein